MPTEIKIPKLGLTMTEATLVEFALDSGERVTAEQIVCVIETDKVSLEIQSPASGLFHPIVSAGSRVAVGDVIGYIVADEKELEQLQAQHPAVQPETGKALDPATQAKTPPSQAPDTGTADVRPSRTDGRVIASPAARKLARELEIELGGIAGSGPGGRIVLKDVQEAVQTLQAERTEAMYDFPSPSQETELLSVAERIQVRGVRKIIAKNMKLSLSSQAQLTLHTEASAVSLQQTRALLNKRVSKDQPKISYNAIITKACALALRRYPMLNSVLEGKEIVVWEQVHIGLAMESGKGLLVPKVRNADSKSIQTISAELIDLAERAAKQKILPDELQGGTFTITNLGSWDIDHFTPINNYPESGILGVGRIIDKPWVRAGAVVAEPRLALSLTFDHRIIDGALGAEFLKGLKDMLEETRLML